VIQSTGLFPHMTVAKNVATVPEMLGWDKARIDKRIDELLNLVGLSPTEYRQRYPAQLSGGQQQRVGLARALAADPSIMLMDEPFAAIDNITRRRLQDELLRIQAKVRKTILFVTHDVEEAIRLADRITIMRSGRVVQYDTPLNILTSPADDFVADLVGAEDALRKLGLLSVQSVALSGPLNAPTNNRPSIPASSTLREALSLLLTSGAEALTVVDAEGKPAGAIDMHTIRQATRGADA
ncbi:MAG TPA: ABC transporter ATP-binding protein, partial [Chloroflexia bacterium]|nr:ABC transporter ATP-binding protein [Chloroflexia bacterium]